MKNPVFALCLLALVATASAENLFFHVYDSDSPGMNISNADIRICPYSEGSFTAGGTGDTITTTPSTATNGCLYEKTDPFGDASFSIEYNGIDDLTVYYLIQRTGYKNTTGSLTMIVQGVDAPSMGAFYVKELNLNLDLTQILLQRNPILASTLYDKCHGGQCSYKVKYVNVSMQNEYNTFKLRWGDIFPACGADYSGNVDTARCAAEFLVPNLHIQSMISLLWQMFLSIFNLQLSVKGVFDWLIGILTPLLIIAAIFIYEVVKTYLLFALTYLSWMTLISVLIQKNVISASTLAWLIPLTVLAIFAGTCWLIGSDINLWKPFVIF